MKKVEISDVKIFFRVQLSLFLGVRPLILLYYSLSEYRKAK